jgi:hypothetical protein
LSQGLEENVDISDYPKAKEGKPAVADQRHRNAKVSITDITTEGENDLWESVRKLAQAHGVWTKMIHTTLHRI